MPCHNRLYTNPRWLPLVMEHGLPECETGHTVVCTTVQPPLRLQHEKQRSSLRKRIEHLGSLPSHHDNETHQGIFISQPCYGDKCVKCSFDTLVLYGGGCTIYTIPHLKPKFLSNCRGTWRKCFRSLFWSHQMDFPRQKSDQNKLFENQLWRPCLFLAFWYRVSSVRLNFECRCRPNFTLSAQCRVKNLVNVLCRNNPFHGPLFWRDLAHVHLGLK